jgi:hypothetical protein
MDNDLSGTIPSDLGELTLLQELGMLGNTQLTGFVPSEQWQLTNLGQWKSRLVRVQTCTSKSDSQTYIYLWITRNCHQVHGSIEPLCDRLVIVKGMELLEFDKRGENGRPHSSLEELDYK